MPLRISLFLMLLTFTGAAWRLQPGVAARRTASLQQYLYSTERLKIMTWNVGRARLRGNERARWEDVPHIAEVILKERADVVALQELDGPEQAEELSRRLRSSYNGWLSYSPRGGSLALLVRRRHKAREAFVLAARRRRRGLAVVFERARVPQPITVTAVHADPFDARRRRLLVEDLVLQTRNRPGHTFLIGDFNLDVWGDARKRGGAATLNDNLTHDAEAYSLLSRYFADLGKPADATALMERRLDYVFARPRNTMAVKATVLQQARGEMDHQPLVVLADLLAKPRVRLGR